MQVLHLVCDLSTPILVLIQSCNQVSLVSFHGIIPYFMLVRKSYAGIESVRDGISLGIVIVRHKNDFVSEEKPSKTSLMS